MAIAGHAGDTDTARAGLDDEDPAVRASALVALARLDALERVVLERGLTDRDPVVRRRACEVAASWHAEIAPAVVSRLDDDDPAVVEVASWALGELADSGPLPVEAVPKLSAIAEGHDDALAREAAVAALGAIGDPAGLPAILHGTSDKPAVRRRAVLALAPFDGPDVRAAIERASNDRDWQVREAAALLRDG